MIRQCIKNPVLGLSQEFWGTEQTLIFRSGIFEFKLVEGRGYVGPLDVYMNDILSLSGSRDLVIFLRDLAINSNEVWSDDQKTKVENARAVYIVYNSQKDMYLSFENEEVNPDYFEPEGSENALAVFVRNLPERRENEKFDTWLNRCNPIMISLVNQLIDYMQEEI
jgi:hypothetical protein